MNAVGYTLLSVVIVSVVSFVGVVTLALNRSFLERIVLLLVAFAVGALIGDAFIHLLPEAFEAFGGGLTAPLYAIAGLFGFFLFEKFVRWHHHGVHQRLDQAGGTRPFPLPVGPLNIIGDGIHNFIDGLLIGASYLVSIPLGIASTIAVVLHEIPQEIGDFGVLLHSGYSVRRALWFNFLSACTAIVGAIVALSVGPLESFAAAMLPITAGGFIYIAAADLIPTLHEENHGKTSLTRSSVQLLMIALGVGIMVALKFLE